MTDALTVCQMNRLIIDKQIKRDWQIKWQREGQRSRSATQNAKFRSIYVDLRIASIGPTISF